MLAADAGTCGVEAAAASGCGWLAAGCRTLPYGFIAAGRYSCDEPPRFAAEPPSVIPSSPEEPASLSSDPSPEPGIHMARRCADRDTDEFRDACVLNGDDLLGLWAAAAAAVAVGDVGSRSSESERQGSAETSSDTVCFACDEAEVLLESVRMMRPPPGVVASLADCGRSYLPAAMVGRQSSAFGSHAP